MKWALPASRKHGWSSATGAGSSRPGRQPSSSPRRQRIALASSSSATPPRAPPPSQPARMYHDRTEPRSRRDRSGCGGPARSALGPPRRPGRHTAADRPEGQQAVDILCYDVEDPTDRYCATNTIKVQGKLFVGKATVLYSDLGKSAVYGRGRYLRSARHDLRML